MMIRKTLLSCALKKRATQLSAGSLMVLCLSTGAALVPLTV
ncbi:MAG TPA: peptidylprolyl isomerase, partial [Halomonas sp.]|nr:peptidylprolyl isomerase [Halomonas sp.]